MADGIFITFEGGEGSGKSTQIKRLKDKLESAGRDVVLTREPGGSPGAEEIRQLLVTGAPNRWEPVTEAMLLAAARHDHVVRTIRPALMRGAIVLCDRFYDSSIAYQGYAHGLGPQVIETLTDIAVGDTRPDLTFIFDMDVETGLARARGRGDGEDRYEQMDLAFHQALRQAYRDIAANHPERCVMVAADQSMDAVEAEIRQALKDRLSL
ncbi:MAG: dTMP kinase [Alphaproteobacteria bacterium]|nr:MAG: dTMP kinase [Alphaproteobacteria bacterium]